MGTRHRLTHAYVSYYSSNMNKVYVPSQGPDDWQQFLADPDKQWKTGYSAKSLAYSWEEAKGFPSEIQQAINDSSLPELAGLEPLLIIPEHKVPLPGGRTESQNDAFVLARTASALAAVTIEGKVEESFGQPVAKWGPDSSPGKTERFNYLVDLLGLQGVDLSTIYYQLLHRTASALIEAERFHADIAVMLVHSFSQEHRWLDEYSAFARAMGVEQPGLNTVSKVGTRAGKMLYLGWVVGAPEYLAR
jgi:hypothetical protein